MNNYILILIVCFISFGQLLGQDLELKGHIDVFNQSGTMIGLNDDFYYKLAPGDVITVYIEGSANLSPYDEERKGGGFIGLFKKSYVVRVDNWVDAVNINFSIKVGSFPEIPLAVVNGKKQGRFVIPFNDGALGTELASEFKMTGYINQPMSPLRAGHCYISVKVDSSPRLTKLQRYFTAPREQPQVLPLLDFENDIRRYVENAKLIYRYPDRTVKIINDALANKPNSKGVMKNLYKYLLEFAPSNATVRANLANVYLGELNFRDAKAEAQKAIDVLLKKEALTPDDPDVLSNNELYALGNAYEVIAGVSELKQLGVQQNAYSIAAVFHGEAAARFLKGGAIDDYCKAIMNQVRCLQKVGDQIALQTAIKILTNFTNASD